MAWRLQAASAGKFPPNGVISPFLHLKTIPIQGLPAPKLVPVPIHNFNISLSRSWAFLTAYNWLQQVSQPPPLLYKQHLNLPHLMAPVEGNFL